MRGVNFHHDGNNSCPGFPESETSTEWEGLTLANGSLYCLRGGWNGGPEGRSVTWNSGGDVSYSEIRGYVQLRLLSLSGNLGGQGDGFAGPNRDIWYNDYADGMSIEIPDTYLHHVYAYIIGSETKKCPEVSGTQPPPYLVYSERGYVCGHVNSDDSIDENGVYQIAPHITGASGGCKFCQSGSPWFHHQLGELVNHPIRLRFVDYLSHPGVHIALTEVELYVR